MQRKVSYVLGIVFLIAAGGWTVSAGLYFRNFTAYFQIWIAAALVLGAAMSCLFSKKMRTFVLLAYQFLMRHKIAVLVAVGAFQLLLIFTAGALAKGDTSVVYAIVLKTSNLSYYHYLSAFPNNFSLFLWFELVHALVGASNLLTALEFLNSAMILASIGLLYQIGLKIGTKKQADLAFFMFVLIDGLSPQGLYTYTDTPALFLVCLSLWLFLYLVKLKGWSLYVSALLFGIFTEISYSVRPTNIILILASWLALLLSRERFKKWLLVSVLIFGSFLIANQAYSMMQTKQTLTPYRQGYNVPVLYFADLGLGPTGSDHSALSPAAANLTLSETSRSWNTAVEADLSHRLSQMSAVSMLSHLRNKFYFATAEGMLGWQAEGVLGEENLSAAPIVQPTIHSDFAKSIRSFVYTTGRYHSLYGFFEQLVWLWIVIGLVFYGLVSLREKDIFHLWLELSLLGFLLYLMIFEAGRSRYLISALPFILILSACGYTRFLAGRNKRLQGKS